MFLVLSTSEVVKDSGFVKYVCAIIGQVTK